MVYVHVFVYAHIGRSAHTCTTCTHEACCCFPLCPVSRLKCSPLLYPQCIVGSFPQLPILPNGLMGLPVPLSGCPNHHARVPVYQRKTSTCLAFWEHSQCSRLSPFFPYRDKLYCGSGNHRWELSCRRIKQWRAMSGGIAQRFNSPLRRWQLNVYKCTRRGEGRKADAAWGDHHGYFKAKE